MSKFQLRIISGLVGTVLVLGILFSPFVVFHIAVGIACFIALHELHVTFSQEKKWQLVVPGYVFALLLLLAPLFFSENMSGLVMFLIVTYLMLLLICSVLWNDSIKFSDAVRSFFSLIYGVLLPLHMSYVRMLDHGIALTMLIFIGSWMPDTFAFFSGRFFGKHKLIPSVSPNKTVEGAVGAIVGAVVSFGIFGLVMTYCFDYTVCYPALFALSLICGVLAQFGDLSASVIKRECNIKDFGNLIPGHGGILDRIDSLVFIAPLVYYFVLVFEVICK